MTASVKVGSEPQARPVLKDEQGNVGWGEWFGYFAVDATRSILEAHSAHSRRPDSGPRANVAKLSVLGR